MSFKRFSQCLILLLGLSLLCACNSFQPTKNVWKGTKGFWNTYVSPPASVDYADKGKLPPEALLLSSGMLGIDVELGKLERLMQNADKPPTQEWLQSFFAALPWVSGFAGVKNDGTILGQEPANSLKDLDFIPLLYEDKKQGSRALRADIEPSPLGPEVMLATPLYDGVDFLGIVVAYFDMRKLMQYSSNADDMVVLSPGALLWPGKYDFAATPLAGVNWQEAVKKSSAGTCSNANGSFFYMVRYLGNLPLVFAVAEKGNFPSGDGRLEQGQAFFPTERAKLSPPPLPERKKTSDGLAPGFGRSEDETFAGEEAVMPQSAPDAAEVREANAQAGLGARKTDELKPGSRESILLKGKQRQKQRVPERALEGENIQVERVNRPRPRKAQPSQASEPMPETPVFSRPSPFGPREETAPEQPSPSGTKEESPAQFTRPSPFGPKAKGSGQNGSETSEQPQGAQNSAGSKAQTSSPASVEEIDAQNAPRRPNVLPGGRPSPFGPKGD